jgi:hypothetical protein
MPNLQNGIYDRKPWVAPPEAAYPPQAYIGPFPSNQERLLSQSMATNTMNHDEIQEYVRPNMPQIELFPARYGYITTEFGIADIIDMSGRPAQRVDYSQQPNATNSTSRNTLGQV